MDTIIKSRYEKIIFILILILFLGNIVIFINLNILSKKVVQIENKMIFLENENNLKVSSSLDELIFEDAIKNYDLNECNNLRTDFMKQNCITLVNYNQISSRAISENNIEICSLLENIDLINNCKNLYDLTVEAR